MGFGYDQAVKIFILRAFVGGRPGRHRPLSLLRQPMTPRPPVAAVIRTPEASAPRADRATPDARRRRASLYSKGHLADHDFEMCYRRKHRGQGGPRRPKAAS